MDSIKVQLMDMGFDESKVLKAIESCPEAETLEQVMEWLIAHEDELNNGSSIKPKPSTIQSDSAKEGALVTSEDKKDDAEGPKDETATNMAARKKITVEEAQRIITERQARRAEEERKKAIEDEKRRRLDGQKMAETRAELEDQERIRLAQLIRREKLEKELHKKQVLEQIARDREAMRNRSNPTSTTTNNTSGSVSSVAKTSTKTTACECKIALRFPDGTSKVQKFSPKEQLSAVRTFVQLEKSSTAHVEFVAPPNKKLTESNMNETLESLGLCPASRLEVKFNLAAWTDLD